MLDYEQTLFFLVPSSETPGDTLNDHARDCSGETGEARHDFLQASAKFFTSSSVSSANSEKERSVISKVVVQSDFWAALGGD